MKNHSSTDNYHEALPFSPFVTGADDDSVLKKAVLRLLSKNSRQITPSPRTADREIAARPIAEQRVVSRYHLNDYGHPRVLAEWEVILHALAWPVMIGVVIGFGLAISLIVIHNPSTLQPQVTWQKGAL